MWAVRGLLAVGLCAQATFGKIHVSFEGVRPVAQEDGGHNVGVDSMLLESTSTGTALHADALLQSSRSSEKSGDRKLTLENSIVKVTNADPDNKNKIEITITKSDGRVFVVTFYCYADDHGVGFAEVEVEDEFLNDENTDVCDDCTLDEKEIACGGRANCENNLVAAIEGDPHMVGLLGQKIDWAGVDGGWYCLLSDGPDFHVNIRLSAPMPEEFPDRQLISAVSILTDDVLHSLVVEVKNPYSTDTYGCPDGASLPCLADGGLRILVDGEESAAMQAPAENVSLPGNLPVFMSATNLPAECRPFGGDRIWATQFALMIGDQRSLRATSVPFDQWIMQPRTLAAPTWCAKFLEEGGSPGLLATRTEHATVRVETPASTVRINVGVNYQDLEIAPDGTVLVPELEFWQMDLGFDGLLLSGSVAGLMGDTSRFVLDDEGQPATSGLGALHGPVESYRVSGPFARDFEKLHG